MVMKTAEELLKFTTDVLIAAGADDRNATRVAEALISSNLCGVDTHGVIHLKTYVDSIRAGEIVPTAWPEILTEDTTSARIGGNWTFGHVTAKYAVKVGIEKAKKDNVAVVGIVQVNHIGRLGEYAEIAASEGMISMIWSGGFGEGKPVAVPYGGRERILSTNPIAMGFPIGDGPPMLIDYATTAIAGSKIHVAQTKDEMIPPDSLIDKEGNPTTDPSAYFDDGALLPFGKHKGYALMLAVEFLGRIFAGADTFAAETRGGNIYRHSGTTMIVLKADLFEPLTDYSSRADELGRRLRAVPPAPGFEEVLIPGDLEARARATRQRDGIPIPVKLWQRLTDLAASLKL